MIVSEIDATTQGGLVGEARTNQLGQEMEGVQILEDVARLVGEEQHVEALERLVHVANRFGFDEGVLDGAGVTLPARAHELGEGGEQALNSNAANVHELTRDKR
jgi:hypothetical protein